MFLRYIMTANLITVTDAAQQHIMGIMQRHNNPKGMYLRIKRSGCSGFRYDPQIVAEVPDGAMQLVIADGLVFFIDHDDKDLLLNTEISLQVGQLQQKKIIFSNPNAVNTCGCGESFAVKDPTNKDDS